MCMLLFSVVKISYASEWQCLIPFSQIDWGYIQVHTSTYKQGQSFAEFWKCKKGVYKHDTVSMSLLNTEGFMYFYGSPRVCVPTSNIQEASDPGAK